MLLRVKLTPAENPRKVDFEGSVLAVGGSPPDVVLHAGGLYVLHASQVGDGQGANLPLLYRKASAMPAIATPDDGAGS